MHKAFLNLILLLLLSAGLSARAEQSAAPVPGTWEFRYQENSFRPDAVLDLRTLNERFAGAHGAIRLSKDGNSFVRGDGQPIRFWGVIVSSNNFTMAQWRVKARFLAKMGVNMVRRVANLPSHLAGSRPSDTNAEEIDNIWKSVAAMKEQGIYTAFIDYAGLDSYGGVDMRQWGIPGYASNYQQQPNAPKPWGVMFFDPQLRAAYKGWLKDFLLRPNPYTGIPLAQDPAVLWNQLTTEDSLLWYTLDGLQPAQKTALGRLYSQWLTSKYGSLDGALAHWQQAAIHEGDGILADDQAHGVLGFYHIWDATQAAPTPGAGKAIRLSDQVEFLARTMRAFNDDMVLYLRHDLRCRSLILANNWRPADALTMQDAERWSYLSGDLIAENHFFTGTHQGPDSGWRVQAGDTLAWSTALKPQALSDAPPFIMKHVEGRATFLTSSAWVYPNLYQTEGPFLCAAYGALCGLSGVCWDGFGGGTEYDMQGVIPINASTDFMLTWNNARPPFMSSFPAAALLYRRGYVRQGDPVVREIRPLADLWQRTMPRIADHHDFRAPESHSAQIDPLAAFVGPIRTQYGGDTAKSTVRDLRRYIDREKQCVLSDTGELALDYGSGVCRLNSPKAQGAIGFMKNAGPIALGAVTLYSENDYAGVLLVALDDQPLARSRKILIQVGTTARPTGWQTEALTFTPAGMKAAIQGERVLATGKAPWRIADTLVTLAIHNKHLARATRLDANGNAAGPVAGHAAHGSYSLTLPPDCLYVVVEAGQEYRF